MKVKEWPIKNIIPYEKNPRKNDAAVKKVMVSLKEYGWQQPIVVDGDGIIIVGHTRLKAAKKLKYKVCPVLVADDLTPAQIKAYRIMDNKSGEMAEWDMDLLQAEIEDLMDLDFDVELTGFDLDEFDFLNDDKTEPEGPPDTEVNMNDIEGNMSIKLEYSFDEYQEIRDLISNLSETPEIIFKRALLGS